jgi:glycosyltransferase involved in cell wall biosynthesis
MRIVIDLQGAQSESRFRGIGRYSLSLAEAIITNGTRHEIFLLLNGAFKESIDEIRQTLGNSLPTENIRVWDAPELPSGSSVINSQWRERAEMIREAVIANVNPDVVLITSLFEGQISDAVVSVGLFETNIPTAVVLYDLIPLVHQELYLENEEVRAWYLHKIESLLRADLILTISESSRREAIQYLAIAETRIETIGAASHSKFVRRSIDTTQSERMREEFGLRNSFILYTGGIDHRKNTERLIAAFALLPSKVREENQLVVVCSVQDAERERLLNVGSEHGLVPGELVLTGYIPDEDLIALYNMCSLFVFPSWHEGFGLPALEAMACGKAVIAANSSSLPEILGRDDALFDPFDTGQMAAKISLILSDPVLRRDLEEHGMNRAQLFSWDITANRALEALERKFEGQEKIARPENLDSRLKLAYFSPLPPAQSGISNYSAELIPELAKYYDLEIIIVQDDISNMMPSSHYPIRTLDWFRSHANEYDRILYHMGNSSYHIEIQEMSEQFPGVVVLHDFYLSALSLQRASRDSDLGRLFREFYDSHGYRALDEYSQSEDLGELLWSYPCCISVHSNALGLIVHSNFSKSLVQRYFPSVTPADYTTITQLKTPRIRTDRDVARAMLGIAENDFVICSFGLLGPNKANYRLLRSWLDSQLVAHSNARLIFVGENEKGTYGQALEDAISKIHVRGSIKITGWVSDDTYRLYLDAADVSVQLRSLSRGETSASVLECMLSGLPVIVNANGSMAELNPNAVWMLQDEFTDGDLTSALEALWSDPKQRETLGSAARREILEKNKPHICGERYFEAIEGFYLQRSRNLKELVSSIASIDSDSISDDEAKRWAASIDRSIPLRGRQRQILVDISILVQLDARSGIQRVVRNILREWISNPPSGYRLEPVYAKGGEGYKYARAFMLNFIGFHGVTLADDPICYAAGDIFLGLDLAHGVVLDNREFYRTLRRYGVDVRFVVYDLLPITLPEIFLSGVADLHKAWLDVITESEGVICISKAVADEVREWLKSDEERNSRFVKVDHFHLGADLDGVIPTTGVPDDSAFALETIKATRSFLMVGTLEPRKGHFEVLAAFENLWAAGVDVCLVIVGKEGWLVESLAEKIKGHPRFGKQLFWFSSVSDEFLAQIYGAASCLIAASKGEGFGLPLIEAAQHNLPIIARDIPVFREVAGAHASYFTSDEPEDLARDVVAWLEKFDAGEHPLSTDMPHLTWAESANQLAEVLLRGK